MCDKYFANDNSERKTFTENMRLYFPELTKLKKLSMDTTLVKMMEEIGELATAMGKLNNINGENNVIDTDDLNNHTIKELVDVMQVCMSFMYVFQKEHPEIDIDKILKDHAYKLKVIKGYC